MSRDDESLEQEVSAEEETPTATTISTSLECPSQGSAAAAADAAVGIPEMHGIAPWAQQQSSWRKRLRFKKDESVEKLAEKLTEQLHVASELLLDRLFSYLSQLPEEQVVTNGDHERQAPHACPAGLTLPAAAIGWISSQLFPNGDSSNDTGSLQQQQRLKDHSTNVSMSASLRDRLSLLRFLLPRATHIRISSETWPIPPPVRRSRKLHRRRHLWTATTAAPSSSSASSTALQHASPHAFIEYFHQTVHRPVIDMRVFSNCKVLLVEQVPPAAICNLHSVQSTLQVLRVEHGCIYDLALLLLPSTSSSTAEIPNGISQQDPLLAPFTDNTDNTALDMHYPKLTHVKLSHCGLNEASNLRGQRLLQGGRGVPPLALFTQLQSLCLAHNDLRSERTALSGLAKMHMLAKLDLSYNHLVSLQHAHYRLGNIQTLLLSHNRIQSCKGIDRLVALETLWLDHNELQDVSAISGLARLPELQSLRLEGNPFAVKRPKVYRVGVLDLFREQRLPLLPPAATYRTLQKALPVLDDKVATLKELVALRERTYVPANGFPTLGREPGRVEESAVDNDHENENAASVVPTAAISWPVGRPTPVQRRSRRRRAHVDVPGTQEPVHEFKPPEPVNGVIPCVAFTLDDVLRSLSPPEPKVEEDVEEAFVEKEVLVKEEQPTETDDQDVEEACRSTDGTAGESLALDTETPTPFDSQLEGLEVSHVKEADTEPSAVAPIELMVEPVAGDSSRARKDTDLLSSQDINVETPLGSTGDLHNLLLSPIKHDNEVHELKESEATAATTAESTAGSFPENDPATPARATTPVDREGSDTVQPAGTTEGQEHATPSQKVPAVVDYSEGQTTPLPSPVQLSLRVVSFPDNVWHDDSSVPSSMGTPQKDDLPSSNKFQLAEDNSTFDGPENYKSLSVTENLELYFRLFVFGRQQAQVAAAHSPDGVEDYEWQMVLQQYPKIQLWPIDRRRREATISEQEQFAVNLDPREEFRRVWREKVVACGKLALRRLTPSRNARYGFHGELLWSASNTAHLKPETTCECRNVIMCLSDTSLYIIVDHDTVTEKAKESKRKFPLPIPQDAGFEKAKWPHALARHPFHTLNGISIGFGFQRLTLRFSNAASPLSEEFTYVLLTANKMETVTLLKEIQDLAMEAKESTGLSLTAEEAIKIDNDDRHVLDALGVAVAPDVIGAVLHFQILKQKWKNGDRDSVRRACVVSDTKLYLLDEDYTGDGSESFEASGTRSLGDAIYRLVDSADLKQIGEVQAADADPNSITIVIRPLSRLQRSHNWRLVCNDRLGAERLVEDVRKAISFAA